MFRVIQRDQVQPTSLYTYNKQAADVQTKEETIPRVFSNSTLK